MEMEVTMMMTWCYTTTTMIAMSLFMRRRMGDERLQV